MAASRVDAWKNALRRIHPGKHRALFDAVSRADRVQALAWLEAGADPNRGFEVVRPVSIRLRQSSLLLAIERHHAPLVQLLLDFGADPEPAGSGMELPLTQWLRAAARSPHWSGAQKKIGLALLQAGANVDRALSKTHSPTLRAVLEGLGKMEAVHALELQAASEEVAQSLDAETVAVSVKARPRF